MQPKELLKTHILHNILKSRNSCNFFEKFLPEIELVLSESSNFPFRHTHMIIGILSIQGVTAKSAHLLLYRCTLFAVTPCTLTS